MGDAMLLEQVLLSLVGNAIEAIPVGGGTITLATGSEGDETGVPRVFVEVRDTGVGIPAVELPKIFAPFYTTKAQGADLGLAMARKFTEAYGGVISVQSHPGESSFHVTFPVQTEA
jgi:signal transduction histidine kinase